jgi:REP element-mobilizing transposase RayT
MAHSKMKVLQLELPIRRRGGKRKGAGRKRRRARPTPAHVKRATFLGREPVQVTMRLCDGLSSLRERSAWAAIVQQLRAVRARGDFRVMHYSVMWNHIHAIVEAESHAAFVAGMRALTIRIARALNRGFGRRGQVFDHRYDARALRSPREVRNALQYVLLNARKHEAEHGRALPIDWVDERSTAVCFDGWSKRLPLACAKDFGTAPAQTWLLRIGWRMHGPLHIDAIPGGVQLRTAKLRAVA